MKCKYEKSCGYEICMMEDCCDFDGAPMTNGDRIREMTDEELATFLAKKFVTNEEVEANGKGVALTATYLSNLQNAWFTAWMQWLRQPAGDGLK